MYNPWDTINKNSVLLIFVNTNPHEGFQCQHLLTSIKMKGSQMPKTPLALLIEVDEFNLNSKYLGFFNLLFLLVLYSSHFQKKEFEVSLET